MKLNILVTSGGTTENIDAVRSISNMSTGKLGSIIAEKFANEPVVEKVIYICSKKAFKPQSNKLEVVYVDSVSSLENAVREAAGKTNIDIIVHSMAVSDYRVKAVTSAANIAEKIVSGFDMAGELDAETVKSTFVSLIGESESVIHGDGKISSNVDGMVLFMEQTPKIISLFQTIAPQSTLVGFKLLDNVPHETLIDRGFHILTHNKCSFVLANDLKDIKSGLHIGYLIDKDRNYTRYAGKDEIADAIVSVTIHERENQI